MNHTTLQATSCLTPSLSLFPSKSFSSFIMSCVGLKKRLPLLPSNKIMRGFTSLIKSSLQKLRRSKTISAASGGVPRSRSRRRHRRRKRAHSATKLISQFVPVYVDELFHHQPAAAEGKADETQPAEKLQKSHHQICASVVASTSNVWETEAAVWDAGEMGEVDLRAEVFIRKFKEEMRLQRQKSIGEYQEMLARGLS